jgi:hypothetical protein
VAWLPVTVVLAFALLVLWRCLLRPAVGELAPAAIARRLPADWDRGPGAGMRETLARRGSMRPSASGILLLLLALALGVLSHIVWDAFSHEGRAGVSLIPALDQQWGPLPGYKWVQHGSSVIGVAILLVWAVLWLRRARPKALYLVTPAALPWVWLASLPIVLAVAWIVGLALFGPLTPVFTAQHLAYRVLPPACGVWGAFTVLLCLVVLVRRRRRS